MKKFLNGEVFLVLFLLSGFYKGSIQEIIPIDVTVLFLGLSVLCAMGRLYKSPNLYRDMLKPVVLYSIICMLMVVSLVFSAGNTYSFDKTFSFLVITGWSFVGTFLLINRSNPKKSIQRFLGAFLFVGTIMVIGVFFSDESLKFTSSFGSNYLALGKMSAIVGLISISYLLLKANSKLTKITALSLFIVSVYALLQSGGRMPVLSFLACLLIILSFGVKFTGFDFKDIKIKKKTLVYSFSGLLILPLLINVMKDKGNIFLNRFLLLFNGGGESALGRTDHVELAWNAFTESYFLGVGAGGYLTFARSLSERAYPHNVFLEFMAELGIIGLASFVILLIIALSRYFKHFFKKSNFYSVTIFLLFVYSLLNAFTSGDFNDNRMLFFFIALLSMSKVFGKSLIKEPKTP